MIKASAALAAVLVATCMTHAAELDDGRQTEELVVQTTIPRSGFSLGFAFDALWMMSDGKLVKVNAADNSVVDIALPSGEGSGLLADIDRYRGIATGEGAVWVPDMASSTIYKVDPHANQVILTIPTDIFGSKGSIGIGAGSVWVITFEDHNKTLTRYSATTSAVEAQVKLPRPSAGVLFDFGSVWVTATNAGELYRIDPSTNQIAATIGIQDASHILGSAEDSIWVAFDSEGIVQRIDARTGEVVATIQTGITDMESDGDIAAGNGFVWIITRGSILSRIDPATNATKGAYAPPPGTVMGRRIRTGAGSLWVSGSSIFRIALPQ